MLRGQILNGKWIFSKAIKIVNVSSLLNIIIKSILLRLSFFLRFNSVLIQFWLSFMSFRLSFDSVFYSVLTQFWLSFVSDLSQFWLSFDSVLTQFWLSSDSVLTQFWLSFDSVLYHSGSLKTQFFSLTQYIWGPWFVDLSWLCLS